MTTAHFPEDPSPFREPPRPKCGAVKQQTAQEWRVCTRRRGHSGAHYDKVHNQRWSGQ